MIKFIPIWLSSTLNPATCSSAFPKVYPVGIPLLYFFILWTKRESLNPTLQAQTRRDAEVAAMPHTTAEELPEDDVRATSQPDSIAGMHVRQGSEEAKAIEERIRQRRKNPDLVPSMFLWKDFGE